LQKKTKTKTKKNKKVELPQLLQKSFCKALIVILLILFVVK